MIEAFPPTAATTEPPPRPVALERYLDIVDDPRAFLETAVTPLPVTVWAHPERIDAETLRQRLAADGIRARRLPWHPDALRLDANFRPGSRLEYVAGLYHVQEEVSLLPVHLLDPQPGERVLDLCAAPGNKTAQLGLAVGRAGTVVANERSLGRIGVLRANLERLGVINCAALLYDATGLQLPPQSYDRVLADVPCGCEGTSRKHPTSVDGSGMPPGRLSDVQTGTLRRAVAACKVGGRIAYATCTYAPEENELVVQAVLRQAIPGSLEVLPARVEGLHGSPGLGQWQGEVIDPELQRTLRVWPHHNNTGGFYVALLEKKAPTGYFGDDEVVEPAGEADPVDRLPVVDAVPHLAPYINHFDIPPETFDDFLIFQTAKRFLSYTTRDLRPPSRLKLHAVGMPFLHVHMKWPKPTTGMVLSLGHAATRNVLDLEPEQTQRYLRKETFQISETQRRAILPGQVLLRDTFTRGDSSTHSAMVGVGLYRAATGEVESWLPKAWKLQTP